MRHVAAVWVLKLFYIFVANNYRNFTYDCMILLTLVIKVHALTIYNTINYTKRVCMVYSY